MLNSDDTWHPEKLERQVRALEAHPEATFCFVQGELIDDGGRVLGDAAHSDWPREGLVHLLPWLVVENRILASGVTFRREAARFDPALRYCGDWVALLEAACKGPGVGIDEPLTCWRQHGTNNYVRSEGVTLEEIAVRRGILAAESRWRECDASVDRGLARCAMNLAALFVLVGKRREAIDAAATALKYAPNDPTARRRHWLARMPLAISRRRLWGRERHEGRAPVRLPVPVRFGSR